MAWRYIRFCPFCKQDKEYKSKTAKNNKHRCPDCLEEHYKEVRGDRFKCVYCKKFKTNTSEKLLYHFTICKEVKGK